MHIKNPKTFISVPSILGQIIKENNPNNKSPKIKETQDQAFKKNH